MIAAVGGNGARSGLIAQAEVLGGEEFKGLLDVRSSDGVAFGEVCRPETVDFLAEDGLEFSAEFLGARHHW